MFHRPAIFNFLTKGQPAIHIIQFSVIFIQFSIYLVISVRRTC